MIALGLMATAVAVVLGALGVTANDLQPSAQRVLVTGVVAAIAPLFWPGKAQTPARTILIVAAWSCAAALLAAATLFMLRGAVGGPSVTRITAVCSMLLLIMLVTHAFAAWIESFAAPRSADPNSARELAGRVACLVLVFLGALPVWLGPAAELAGNTEVALIDPLLSISPLTHLAVASGNDLLRNQWFYQHSNLAGVRYSYPDPAAVATGYVVLGLAFALLPVAMRRLARALHLTTSHFRTERIS
jgi:hypothetical protein